MSILLKMIINILKKIFLIIGFFTVCGIIFGVSRKFEKLYSPFLTSGTYLTIDFSNDFSETEKDDIISGLLGKEQLRFQKLISTIEFAAQDKDIEGIVADINIINLELAQVQEIATAIKKFRASGKKAYVYSQGFGPFGQGNKEYYLASHFDEIYMQPHSSIGINGINIEVPFVKNALEKIGVQAEFYARHEYKNAAASFTDNHISEAQKEELQKLGSELFAELRNGITQNRKLGEDFINIVNRAPISAEDGVKLNLIDGLMYRDELKDKLKKEGSEQFVDIIKYASALVENSGDYQTIAILNLNGEITEAISTSDFSGENVINSKKVIKDIQSISETTNLKGVIVRINSPGGSYMASDEIYHALKKLKNEKNIPLFVSQSGYAASGGYFISLAGDKIFADGATITGSIGVLGGKPVLQGLWDKLGINWANVSIGKNAGILSINHPFSPEEKQLFNKNLDDIYADFIAKVKENRPQIKNIDSVARGRIWLGRSAQKVGLVDEIGGLNDAIYALAKQTNILNEGLIRIIEYPKAESLSDKLDKFLNDENLNLGIYLGRYDVNIEQLKLFKRLQYDSVLQPISINM